MKVRVPFSLALLLLLPAAASAQEEAPGNFPFNNTTAIGAEEFLKAHMPDFEFLGFLPQDDRLIEAGARLLPAGRCVEAIRINRRVF